MSNLSVERITRQKLSEQVFDRLWEMISSGELSPGDAMPSERALMDRFSVGRPAVREALQSMANKGLITISHGERSRVNELDAGTALSQVDDIAKLLLSSEPTNLGHLKQLRKILEAGSVRIAAELCTSQDVSDLLECVECQKRHEDDQQAFIKADIDFHVRLAAISKNPLLKSVTQAMLSWLFEYYRPVLHWTGREQTTVKEHEELVRFLETGDANAATQLLRDHLNRSDPLYRTEE